MTFDPSQFIGLTGIPLIEQIVQYLKKEWRMPSYLAPLAALAAGVGINLGIGYYTHIDFLTAIYVGLFTGFSSSYWHEMARPATPTITLDKPVQ